MRIPNSKNGLDLGLDWDWILDSRVVNQCTYYVFQDPIIHGNLTCDTIFIQHNGLVKIGSVAPDAIHKNVKTFKENMKNFHFLAPEQTGKL